MRTCSFSTTAVIHANSTPRSTIWPFPGPPSVASCPPWSGSMMPKHPAIYNCSINLASQLIFVCLPRARDRMSRSRLIGSIVLRFRSARRHRRDGYQGALFT